MRQAKPRFRWGRNEVNKTFMVMLIYDYSPFEGNVGNSNSSFGSLVMSNP